jgi:hypothetical protein
MVRILRGIGLWGERLAAVGVLLAMPTPTPSVARPAVFAGVLLATAVGACASGPSRPPGPDPATIASVEAVTRVVGVETTLVARGTGYDLVARSRTDIAAIQHPLDQLGQSFRAAFGDDPPRVVVSVGHAASDGTFDGRFPPVVPDTAPIAEVVLGERPLAGREGNGARPARARGAAGGGAFAALLETAEPSRIVLRSWLSGRASRLTGHPATGSQASGESDDPRVPSWGVAALPALGADSARLAGLARLLSASGDSIYPLSQLLTMDRPPMTFGRPDAVATGGGRDGGGYGGGRGGMGGGRGGMGGGRGGMGGGRGGMGGGRGAPGGQRPGGGALQGGALFSAEAVALGGYLASREGAPFVGALLDAQMQGRPVASVLSSAKVLPGDIARLEDQWRHWLAWQGSQSRR